MEHKLRVIEGRRNGRTNRVFYLQRVDLMRSKEFYGLTRRQFYLMKSKELEKHIYEYLVKRYKGPTTVEVAPMIYANVLEAFAHKAFHVVLNRDFDWKLILGDGANISYTRT